MAVVTWFQNLSRTGKSFTALGAAVVLGFTLMAAFGGHVGLPAQVGVNTRDIGELQGTMTDILCILTQPEGANPMDCVQPPGE